MRTLEHLVVVIGLTAAVSGCLQQDEWEDIDSTAEVEQASEGVSWTRAGFFPGGNPFARRGFYHPMSWYGGVPGVTTGHRDRAGEACSYFTGVHKLGRLVLNCPTNNYASCNSVCVPRSGILFTPQFVTPTWHDDRLYPRASNPFLTPSFVHIMSHFPESYASASRVGEKCTTQVEPNGPHKLGTLIYDCITEDYETCISYCRPD